MDVQKEIILKELKEKFDETKKSLKFKSGYEEINSICYLDDFILATGFVSNHFSRQMINRLLDTFSSWVSELHSWIFPQSYDLIHTNEAKVLSPQDRKEILNMIDRLMYLLRKNKRIAFDNLKGEGEFLDELVNFNKTHFNSFALKYNLKLEEFWKKELSN